SSVDDLIPRILETSPLHRVKLTGVVTYLDDGSFFMQDDSGGVRVHPLGNSTVKPGETVEVAGFPAMNGGAPTVTEALVRSCNVPGRTGTKKLDLNEAVPLSQIGTLIHINANLLSQKNAGSVEVLELQEQQRVFEATLESPRGHLPHIAPGSRLAI